MNDRTFKRGQESMDRIEFLYPGELVKSQGLYEEIRQLIMDAGNVPTLLMSEDLIVLLVSILHYNFYDDQTANVMDKCLERGIMRGREVDEQLKNMH